MMSDLEGRTAPLKLKEITAQQLEKGLTDKNLFVRSDFLRRKESLTDDQLERALTDDKLLVRIVAAQRPEAFTTEQIERGLNDDNFHVKQAFIDRFFNINS